MQEIFGGVNVEEWANMNQLEDNKLAGCMAKTYSKKK